MGIKVSHIAALVIAAGVAGWMWSGELVEGGIGPQGDPVVIAARNAEADAKPFAVRTVVLEPTQRAETLTIRGRTELDASVPVRVETSGTVEARLVEKGEVIAAGTEVCRLDAGTREAVLRQAEAARAQATAQLEQARFDLDSNTQLAERGFAAESRLNQLRAAADAAQAGVASAEAQIAQAREELERTTVVASVGGLVQDPIAEVGDVLQPGGVCVTLVDTDPLVVTGQVAETEVGSLEVGMETAVRLVTGEEVAGAISFIAAAADPETRTFQVDVSVPNPDATLRAGVTATARVALAPIEAFPIKASWITLDDAGRIGVGVVEDDSTVAFRPLRVLAQDVETTWVTGLEAGVRVITLGADYVVPGQRVAFQDVDAPATPGAADPSEERTASLRTTYSPMPSTALDAVAPDTATSPDAASSPGDTATAPLAE